MTQQPRGVRNNNPGNIEENGTAWQGLDTPKSDGRFCRFIDPKWGIRAIARVLITYQDKHGVNTVRGIIDRWAPPVENNTSAYIDHVCRVVGVGRADAIDLHQYKYAAPIVEAIIKHENGQQPYSKMQINEGLRLAGIEPDAQSHVGALDQERPLNKSRTIKGSRVAGGAGAAATIAGITGQLTPAIPVLNWVRDNLSFALIVLGVAVLAGVGYAVYARLDDRKKGLR